MFPVMYYVVRYRREIIRENITNSFPDKTYKERIAIEKKHYRFFCDQIVETIKEFSISPKEMSRRMEFRGLDEACSDLEASPYAYVFLYLGHYCNWEWISSLGIHLPDNQCCAQIYHPLRNAHFNTLFLKILESIFNLTVLALKQLKINLTCEPKFKSDVEVDNM